MTTSAYRTVVQKQKLANATASGYVWERDSDYQLKLGRGRFAQVRRGCLVILKGRPTGFERAMIIYPDGGVVVNDIRRGGGVTFNRNRLAEALRAVGAGAVSGQRPEPRDEDEHFMESQQR